MPEHDAPERVSDYDLGKREDALREQIRLLESRLARSAIPEDELDYSGILNDAKFKLALVTELKERRASPAPVSGVAVKPLEWIKHPNVDMWRCDTVVGLYQVAAIVRPATWTFDGLPGQTASGEAVSKQEAMAACQADYEHRILAALSLPTPSDQPAPNFQERVAPWMQACFGPQISADKLERSDRFIEEAIELVQASNYPKERVLALVDYVYGRDQGDINQEVGGVMVTLAAHCLAHGVDMHEAGEIELARIWTKVDAIRAKQAAKPTGSALPVAAPPAPVEVTEAWREFEGDFNALTDNQIAEETQKAEHDLEQAERWLEAVASWEAAGRPRAALQASKPSDQGAGE